MIKPTSSILLFTFLLTCICFSSQPAESRLDQLLSSVAENVKQINQEFSHIFESKKFNFAVYDIAAGNLTIGLSPLLPNSSDYVLPLIYNLEDPFAQSIIQNSTQKVTVSLNNFNGSQHLLSLFVDIAKITQYHLSKSIGFEEKPLWKESIKNTVKMTEVYAILKEKKIKPYLKEINSQMTRVWERLSIQSLRSITKGISSLHNPSNKQASLETTGSDRLSEFIKEIVQLVKIYGTESLAKELENSLTKLAESIDSFCSLLNEEWKNTAQVEQQEEIDLTLEINEFIQQGQQSLLATLESKIKLKIAEERRFQRKNGSDNFLIVFLPLFCMGAAFSLLSLTGKSHGSKSTRNYSQVEEEEDEREPYNLRPLKRKNYKEE